MPHPRVYLNNIEVAVANIEELNSDYTWAPNSPTPVPEQPDTLELWATGDRYDGYNVVSQWVQNNGVVNGIPVRIIDDFNEVIYDGFGDFADERTHQNAAKKYWVLALKDGIFTFTELCDGLNLHRFSPTTSAAQNVANWSPVKNYRKLEIVRYENKFYVARVANRDKRPDLFEAAWIFAGDTPLPNAFNFSDFPKVYYIISTVPDGPQVISTAITIYILTTELYRNIKFLADGANPLTPNQVITTLIYIAAQLTALLLLFDTMLDKLFTIPKQYNAVRVRDLFERGFNSIGYSFRSSILSGDYRNLCIIAPTTRAGKTNNPDNNPVPEMTLMQLMEIFAGLFGAKFNPNTEKKEVVFERIDAFWNRPTQTELPLTQESYSERYNLSELKASWKMSYQKDDVETNTHTSKNESSCTVHYTLSNVTNKAFIGLRESHTIDLPFARGVRKVGSTELEDILNVLVDIFSLFLGNSSGNIGSRENMMLLNADFIGVPKLVMIDEANKRLLRENDDKLNPSYLYAQYHRTGSTIVNQWIICKEETEMPLFPQRTVRSLRNNNVVRRADGKICVLNALRRNIETGLHEIEYRYRQTYLPQSQITETIIPTY